MAQTTGGDTPSPETPADIVVTARSASASITGSHTPLLRYPQSVRVLDEDDLTPLNATRLQDALDYAGGVTRQNDFGGLWTNMRSAASRATRKHRARYPDQPLRQQPGL